MCRLLFACLLFISSDSFSQNVSGLYLTAADYKNGSLAYSSQVHSSKNRIVLHDVLGYTNKLTIIHDGQAHQYCKSEVWGYKDHGKTFRFYNKGVYQLVDSGCLLIYTHEENVSAGKGFKKAIFHYFSLNADSAVLPLNASYLQKVFPGNEWLRGKFAGIQYRNEIDAYDFEHKMYLANYICLMYSK